MIATEFGDGSTCDGTYSQQVIDYANAHNASWTAWAWFPGGCGFPSIISDWSGSPSAAGMAVKNALARY